MGDQSLMSLMQTALWPWSSASGGAAPAPSPAPSGGIGFTPDEINQITSAIVSGGAKGSSKTPSVPAVSTRERNATIGSPSVNNPLVFWGSTPRHSSFSGTPAATGEGHGSTFVSGGGDHQLTIEQASNQVFTWSPEKVKEMTAKLTAAGFKITSFDDLKSAWASVVSRAAGMYSVSNGKNKVTPDDVIAMSTAETTAMGGSTGGSSNGTHTTRTVGTITNAQGWSTLRSTMSQMLGRDPSDSEVRDFVGRMNHLAAAHPTIETSTTTGDNTTTHVRPGFSGDDVLQNAYQDAQANPDYAEHQAATTYFNAALSALGQIGG